MTDPVEHLTAALAAYLDQAEKAGAEIMRLNDIRTRALSKAKSVKTLLNDEEQDVRLDALQVPVITRQAQAVRADREPAKPGFGPGTRARRLFDAAANVCTGRGSNFSSADAYKRLAEMEGEEYGRSFMLGAKSLLRQAIVRGQIEKVQNGVYLLTGDTWDELERTADFIPDPSVPERIRMVMTDDGREGHMSNADIIDAIKNQTQYSKVSKHAIEAALSRDNRFETAGYAMWRLAPAKQEEHA